MSVTHEFREDICYVTASGRIDKPALDAHFQQMRIDPQFVHCRGILLIDQNSIYLPSMTDIKSTAFGLRTSIGGFAGKIAVVVYSNVKYGLGRVLESLSADQNLRIFKTLEAAERWMAE